MTEYTFTIPETYKRALLYLDQGGAVVLGSKMTSSNWPEVAQGDSNRSKVLHQSALERFNPLIPVSRSCATAEQLAND